MTSVALNTPERATWLAARKLGIGGSDIGAVVGVDPFKTALDVYLDKTGQVEPFEGNEFTLWGNRLEGVIAEEYAERVSVTVRSSPMLVHPEFPWALCTPDRLVYLTDEQVVPDWGVEIKNRNHFNKDAWGEPGSDEVPHEVAAQSHWCMFVTGLRRWDVAVLLGGNRLGIYTLEYDEELATSLRERAHAFWHEHVIPRITPPLDGSESSRRYLNGKWPLHGEGLKAATPDIVAAAERLRQVRGTLDTDEAAKSALENLIKDFIGEQAGVALPDGSKITWKRPKASTRTNWEGLAQGLKSRLTDEEWLTVVGLNTTEQVTARRFLCSFKEAK